MLRCAMPADDADSPAGAPLFPKADFCSRFEVLVNEVHFSGVTYKWPCLLCFDTS